ncbi:MAG: glucose-1-phosphate adenylyltransferase [Pirellulales bacterium]|nr:glucose-1-phosphate adenylyltransferase [Pirellulales bacterium]
MSNVLAIVLAGGRGNRLDPLTRDRAKPAVPFGGSYRIVDFTLSNCINSGLMRILVLTQYKSASLDRHLRAGWMHYFQRELGNYLDLIPPQQRISDDWYRGTADAIYQNLYSVERSGAEYVVVLAGDHIYKMDYRAMIEQHRDSGAAVTVAALRVPVGLAARQFGVMEVDTANRILAFAEKPEHPRPLPNDPEHCLASMGIYVFSTPCLLEELMANANAQDGGADFGHHVLPRIVDRKGAVAHEFQGVASDGRYWRDVGTIAAYYQASMELLNSPPPLDLFDEHWPIRSGPSNLPAPRILLATARGPRVNAPRPNIIAGGTVIEDAVVDGSIIGRGCYIAKGAVVRNSVLFDGVTVGANALVERAILDKDVEVAAATLLTAQQTAPQFPGVTVTENMILCVPQGMAIDAHRNVLAKPARYGRSQRDDRGARRIDCADDLAGPNESAPSSVQG